MFCATSPLIFLNVDLSQKYSIPQVHIKHPHSTFSGTREMKYRAMIEHTQTHTQMSVLIECHRVTIEDIFMCSTAYYRTVSQHSH